MDLAKLLARWQSQPPEQWLAQVNRVLPPLVVSVLVIVLAFQAAGLTWRLLDQPARQDEVPPAIIVAAAMPTGGAGNLEPLGGWEPFGHAPEQGTVAVDASDIIDAPLTTLALRLHGTLQHQELPERGSVVIPEAGAATISLSGGTAMTYHTGFQIENTPVKLHSVYYDSVRVIYPDGRLEKLTFPDASELASNTGRTTNRQQPQLTFRAQQLTASPAEAVEAATGAAAIFGQHITLRMQLEGDQMIGYRVEPRNDSPVLSRLGLEPGDVLTEINGMPLGDLRRVNDVLQALQQSPQANVMVRRNGTNIPMSIDMGQVQSIAESLQ